MPFVPLSVCVFVLLFVSACAPHAGPQARWPAPEVLPSASPTTRPEASAPDTSDKLPQSAAEPMSQPAVPSPSASLAGTGGSGAESTLLPVSPLHDPLIRGGGSGSGGGSTGGSTGAPQPSPTPLFYIADVTLADTGQSVMGADAPAAIAPVYTADAPIDLLISGNFATTIPFSEAAMRFTFEPGLLHQSFSGDAPAVRVLLNESLLLEPIEIQSQALRVRLHSRAVPDLQYDGLLSLQIIAGGQQQSQWLKLAVPFAPGLLPVVDTASAVNMAGQDYLRVRGRHFFLKPEANQCRLNGQPLEPVSTNIFTDAQSELWLHLNLQFLVSDQNQVLTCQTPRGINSYQWQQED